MNKSFQNLFGMESLSDQVIAIDFLIAAKSAVRNYSIALTEVTSPELRDTLRDQLKDAIATHERISDYMTKKGYYDAYDLHVQYKVDMDMTESTLKFAEQKR